MTGAPERPDSTSGGRVKRGFRTMREAAAVPDALLFGWVAVAEPVLVASSAMAPTDAGIGATWNPLLGALYLAAGAAVLIAVVTRDAGTGDRPQSRTAWEVTLAAATVLGVLLVLSAGAQLLAAQLAQCMLVIVAGGVLVVSSLRGRLRAIPENARRLLVTPYVMAAAGVFDETLAMAAEGLDLELIREILTGGNIGLLLTLGLAGIVVSGIFYAVLIFAARRLAGDRSDAWVWLIRYGVFVVSVLIGIRVSGVLAGA